MTDEIGRREFIKRGTVAGVVATTGLAAAPVARAATLPVAPSNPATPGTATMSAPHPALATRHLDSKEFCLSEYDALRPALSFSAKNASDARRWQQKARTRLIERLGGFPAARAPLNAQVLESRDFGSYTREKLVFDTRTNLSTIGYLLLPKAGTRPLPAVVCVSGHGRGLPDILGLDDQGNPRAERNVGYASEDALQRVQHGHATL